MTGLPEYNYPEFDLAEGDLRNAGHKVLNPARRGIINSWVWADYLRAAIRDVTVSDAVALLPGWEKSKGATLEVQIARALGLRVDPLPAYLQPVGKPVES